MKKLMTGITAVLLTLALLCAGALAQAPDLTGEWYTRLFGLVMTLDLQDDGQYIMHMDLEGEESDEGTWIFDGSALVLDAGSEAETTLVYDADSVSLSMAEDGIEVLFTREVPAAFEAAPVRTDATLDEFAGAWACTLVDAMGMQASPELIGIDLGLKIEGSAVTLTLTEFSDPVEATLEGSFADGTLTVILPAENEFSEETAFALRLLQDGTMSVTTSFLDEAMVCYMSLAAE